MGPARGRRPARTRRPRLAQHPDRRNRRKVFRGNVRQAPVVASKGMFVAQPTVKLFGHCSEIASYASHEVARISSEAVAARGVFSMALAGGSTPKMLYAL